MAKSTKALFSLELVSAHLADWRQHRLHQRAAIPESLWCEVVSLLDNYAMADIARELKIKPQQIRQKAHDIRQDTPEFIDVSLSQASDSPGISMVELVHPGGLTLKLPSISDKQFDSLITHFISSC